MNKYALGHRINVVRKEKGITGEKLAELCNINPIYLRQIEGGAKTPSLPVFVTICQQLHVSPSYLLAEDFEENESSDLSQLLANASPHQLSLVNAMIRSALDIMK